MQAEVHPRSPGATRGPTPRQLALAGAAIAAVSLVAQLPMALCSAGDPTRATCGTAVLSASWLLAWLGSQIGALLGVGLLLTAAALAAFARWRPASEGREATTAPTRVVARAAVSRRAILRGALGLLVASLVLQILCAVESVNGFNQSAFWANAIHVSAPVLQWLSTWVGALGGVGLLLLAAVLGALGLDDAEPAPLHDERASHT